MFYRQTTQRQHRALAKSVSLDDVTLIPLLGWLFPAALQKNEQIVATRRLRHSGVVVPLASSLLAN